MTNRAYVVSGVSRTVQRFMRVSAADRALLAEALLLLLIVRVALHLVPFSTLRKRLDRRAVVEDRPVDRVAWAVGAAARRVPGTTCLAEALVAHNMLRRHGHAPVLRIGVREGDSSPITAHAWVECDGAVVMGAVDNLADHAVLS